MHSRVAQIMALYRRTAGEPPFPIVQRALRDAGVSDLCDEIADDAEARRLLGRPCDTERWTPFLPPGGTDAAALDSIVTAVLGEQRDDARFHEACRELGQRGPEFSAAVTRFRLVRAVLDGVAQLDDSARRDAPPFPAAPSDFGPMLRRGELRFHLRRVLGEGSSGVAYDAIDRRYSEDGHEHRVVVKVLAPALADRVDAEARRGSRVQHPGVVRWLDWGVSPDRFGFVVSEFVPARSLEDPSTLSALGRGGAVEVLRQMADALSAVHSAGIIHMDVKPANILVDSNGLARLCDFGAATPAGGAATPAGGGAAEPVATTPFFAAPEVLAGGPPTIGADLYSLGAVLRWCMDELDELGAPRLAPGDSDRLESIWLHAMSRDPQRRYGLARDFAADLAAWLVHRPLSIEAPSPLSSVRLSIRRDPVTWALATAAVVALLLLGWSWMDARLVEARHRAERLLEEARRLRAVAALSGYVDRLDSLARSDGLSAAPQVLALQWLVGASGINAPALHSRALGAQRAAWQEIVTGAEQRGDLDRLEPRLAELCLAIEQLDHRSYKEARGRMAAALPWWRERFAADDPVREMAESIAMLAEAGADSRAPTEIAAAWSGTLERIRTQSRERAPRIADIAESMLARLAEATSP
ncbi:MAG: serine/threonine protein kinase [Phycisphaerae bacterium]|nr:serine/threonine protein kinase [Phycisphaerae bacterium]